MEIRGFVEDRGAVPGCREDDVGRPVHRERGEHLQGDDKVYHRDPYQGLQQRQQRGRGDDVNQPDVLLGEQTNNK